jgi:hypothetical protein
MRSVRTSICTVRHISARYSASVIAVLPPPTTTTSRFLKKLPSHVAQYDTPCHRYSFSPGTSRCLYLLPVASTTRRACISCPRLVCTVQVSVSPRDIVDTLSCKNSDPDTCACVIKSRIMSPPGADSTPGQFSTQCDVPSAPPGSSHIIRLDILYLLAYIPAGSPADPAHIIITS